MNETLKGVAHIGAELAAVKADLQREMERHRKTWTQLEQMKGLLREIEDEALLDNSTAARIQIALSQQAEPVKPAPTIELGPNGSADRYFYECGFEAGKRAAEPAPAQTSSVNWEAVANEQKSIIEQLQAKLNAKIGPAPAQDELLACPFCGGGPKLTNGDYVHDDLRPMAVVECKSCSAWVRVEDWNRRPAQTEQQPVAMQPDCDAVAVCGCRIVQSRKLGNVIILCAAHITQTAPQGKFRMGDLVKKSTGSEWEGHICGTYSTEQTPEGYAVESAAHRGSVQIYPDKALELVPSNE